jgi:hypothetical protein
MPSSITAITTIRLSPMRARRPASGVQAGSSGCPSRLAFIARSGTG